MLAQIGLGHWRDRVVPHRGMAVEAKYFTRQAGAGEEVAEDAESLQRRRAYHERHELVLEYTLANFDCSADAADCG
jgi:hypothetical protein